MTRAEFWALIAAGAEAAGDAERKVEIIEEVLAKLRVKEIVDFDRILRELMAESYRGDLWGAAYVINGGCSDDGFDYFRGWLILQGERVFSDALRDPDSLAAVPMSENYDVECEAILYAAANAHEARVDRELPDVKVDMPAITLDWTEEDLPTRFPALSARFDS